MEIYGLKTCDTCRKAIKALPLARFVDVRIDGVPGDVVTRARTRFGDALVNTRSTTWRGLSEDERAQSPAALMAAHPALMKRPLIVDGDAMYLGWTKEVQTALGVC
jgi:arsenate reductase